MVVPALVGTVSPKVAVVVGGLLVVDNLVQCLEVDMQVGHRKLEELLEVGKHLVDSTVLEVVVDILALGAVGKRMDCRVVASLEELAGY